MSQEFKELNRRIEELKKWHLRAAATFAAFEQIQELRAPNILGKDEAQKNAQAMSRYKGFFNTAEKAVNLEFLLSLAKLYDSHKDSLHIVRLVNFAEQNQKKLTVDDFADFHEGRQYIDELKSTYEGLSRDDLLQIKADLDNVAPSILKLKKLRDERLAHINLSVTEETYLTYQEIADLIELSEKILKTMEVKHNQSSSYFKLYIDQVKNDTKALVGLARIEMEHPREIGELLDD